MNAYPPEDFDEAPDRLNVEKMIALVQCPEAKNLIDFLWIEAGSFSEIARMCESDGKHEEAKGWWRARDSLFYAISNAISTYYFGFAPIDETHN